MHRILLLALATCCSMNSFAQFACGDIVGTVVEDDSGFPVFSAHVYLDDAGGQRYQTKTDLDGRFRISQVPAGAYEMNIRYLGDTLIGIPVTVELDRISFMDTIEFPVARQVCWFPEIPQVIVPIDFSRTTLTEEDIDCSPHKFEVKQLLIHRLSDTRITPQNELSFRAGRPSDVLYMVDGVKVRSLGLLPSAAIVQINVYTDGIPAKFGDTTSGVVEIETKSYFDLYEANN